MVIYIIYSLVISCFESYFDYSEVRLPNHDKIFAKLKSDCRRTIVHCLSL